MLGSVTDPPEGCSCQMCQVKGSFTSLATLCHSTGATRERTLPVLETCVIVLIRAEMCVILLNRAETCVIVLIRA